MRCMPSNKATSGFTLVEMLVIAPIVLLTIATFIGVLIYLTGETLIARTSNVLAYDVQDSLNNIEYDIATSGAFLATNSVAISSPQGYDNAAQNFTNASTTTGSMLIINTAATSDSTYWADRQVIPLRDMPHACASPLVHQNQVLTYNIVYFVKDNALWRRTLMPSNYLSIGCDGYPWQKPSCAEGMTGTMCVVRDVKMLDGITSAGFTVEYLTSAKATTPLAEASNPANNIADRQLALSITNTAIITLNATRLVAGQEINYSGSVRATRVGPLSEQVTPVP